MAKATPVSIVGPIEISGGGGGGTSEVEVTNPEAISPGTGPVDDAAYADDTGAAEGTLVALLKGVYVQNAAIIALLTQIEANTNTE